MQINNTLLTTCTDVVMLLPYQVKSRRWNTIEDREGFLKDSTENLLV